MAAHLHHGRGSTFRPRARLVSILGEHLISDQAVGLIELVKNCYDADATEVGVELLNLEAMEETTVAVTDNGFGMLLADVTEKWLSPAVDHKEGSKQLRKLANRFPTTFELYDFSAIGGDGHLHAKALVVDRRLALVGSANLTFQYPSYRVNAI